jgi:[ribosomal protein S18]-alanine N-acetyltransferase
MVQILSLAVFAILLARVVRAPRGTWRWIVAAAVAALAASQLLPSGNAFREDVRGSLDTLFWLGLALLPVAGYALVIRAIRQRTQAVGTEAVSARPTGLVLIPEDGLLARDTEAAIAEESGSATERVSIGWRDDGGALVGHARLRLHRDLADLELLWVAPGSRGRGIGGRLVAQAAAEARRRGARALLAAVEAGGGPAYLARHGFRPYGSLAGAGTAGRLHLLKALT